MKTKIIFLLLLYSSFCLAQLPDSDIWLMDFNSTVSKIALANPVNITKRAGYDNQPVFSPDGKYILYSSVRNGKQSDIYKYDLKTKKTKQFCKTAESEYSPAFMPGGKNISVVRVEKDSSQRLWKFPVKGGDPSLIMDKINSIAYYCWLNEDSAALVMNTKPSSLLIMDIHKQEPIVDLKNIGRCIVKTPGPGQNTLCYLVQDQEKKWVFQMLHLTTMKSLSDVPGDDIPALEGSEDFAFCNTGLLMCKGSKVFCYFAPSGYESMQWNEIADLASWGITNITRISVSPDGKKIALVSNK